MTVTGMLIYSVLMILHYYLIIIFYYDNITLSYHHIILAQYSISWHFVDQGFCSRMAPYQWFWITEDCFRHRISAHIFSMFKNTLFFHNSFVFFGPRPLGPGPTLADRPAGSGRQTGRLWQADRPNLARRPADRCWDLLTFCKMVLDL